MRPVFPEFIDFFVAERPASQFNQPGIHSNAFIDVESFLLELPQNGGVNLIHGIFGQSFFHPVRNSLEINY